MEEILKQRAAARGWLTRASKRLSQMCRDTEVDKILLTDAMDEFDKQLEKLDKLQSQVESGTDLTEIEAEVDRAATFREDSRVARLDAAKLLSMIISSKEINATRSVAGTSAFTSVEAKLPKLELPNFSGDVTAWQSFWDQFSAVIDKSEIPEVNKFAYLLSLLKGEARSTVQGLSLTAEHYGIACKLLQERYGRKDRIVFLQVQELLKMTVPTAKDRVASLWKLQDDLLSHIRSLEALQITGAQYGVILTPLILSRLPNDIRLEWARDGEGHESDLEWLLDFLKREIQRRERSQTFKDNTTQDKNNTQEERHRMPAVATLQSSSNTGCGVCGKGHPTERCFKLTKASQDDCQIRMRRAGLCFNCLEKGHVAQGCDAKCARCEGKHHAIICKYASFNKLVSDDVDDIKSKPDLEKSECTTASGANFHNSTVSTVTNVNTQVSVGKHVLLQIVNVSVRGLKGNAEVNILFDNGADRSYISGDLVKRIAPEWVGSVPLSYAAFGSRTPSKMQNCNVYEVHTRCSDCTSQSLFVTEIPVICAPIYRPEIPDDILKSVRDIEISTLHSEGEQVKIDLLIGSDAYWKFMKPGFKPICGTLVALDTVFGWIFSGSILNPEKESSVISHQLTCISDVSDTTLRKSWNLESIGINDNDNTGPDTVLCEFEENVAYVDGRYEVALPWKKGKNDKLMNNENQALDKFQGRWSMEYLCKLPPGRGPDAKRKVQKGTVVVISEDKTQRLSWPVGVVTELFPGKDGRVRTVKVKTSKGSLIRPIQHLHDLEIIPARQEDITGNTDGYHIIDEQATRDTNLTDNEELPCTLNAARKSENWSNTRNEDNVSQSKYG